MKKLKWILFAVAVFAMACAIAVNIAAHDAAMNNISGCSELVVCASIFGYVLVVMIIVAAIYND